MVRLFLILVMAIGIGFLAPACSQPAVRQIDNSQYPGRLDKVTLEIPTIA